MFIFAGCPYESIWSPCCPLYTCPCSRYAPGQQVAAGELCQVTGKPDMKSTSQQLCRATPALEMRIHTVTEEVAGNTGFRESKLLRVITLVGNDS